MTNRQTKALSLVRHYKQSGELCELIYPVTLEESIAIVDEQLDHLTHEQRVSNLEFMGYRVGNTEQAVKNKHNRVLGRAYMKIE